MQGGTVFKIGLQYVNNCSIALYIQIWQVIIYCQFTFWLDNSSTEEKGKINFVSFGWTPQWNHVERYSGKFQRWFRVPKHAKVDQVKANMENGELIITIPKKEVKKNETKVIQIKGN
jgi:hypothetical protein